MTAMMLLSILTRSWMAGSPAPLIASGSIGARGGNFEGSSTSGALKSLLDLDGLFFLLERAGGAAAFEPGSSLLIITSGSAGGAAAPSGCLEAVSGCFGAASIFGAASACFDTTSSLTGPSSLPIFSLTAATFS